MSTLEAKAAAKPGQPRARSSVVLRAARERISDPAHWVKGFTAVDADGKNVHPGSVSAVAWCMHGALGSLADEFSVSSLNGAYWQLIRQVPAGALSVFNDRSRTTHARVLAAFDRAITAAEIRERYT